MRLKFYRDPSTLPPMSITAVVIAGSFSEQCGMQSRFSSAVDMIETVEKWKEEDLLKVRDNYETCFERSDPFFWKMRCINQMLASSDILSISFLPSRNGESEVVFMQKGQPTDPRVGFVAPYLSAKEQRTWKASLVTQCEIIRDENSMLWSTIRLGKGIEGDTQNILRYFLSDPRLKGISLTFQDQVTYAWIKA